MNKFAIKNLLFVVLLGAAITTPIVSSDQIPEQMTLTYSVEKSGPVKGQYEVQFTRHSGRLITSSTAIPKGIAATLSNDETKEKVVYQVNGDDLIPLRYSESRSGRKNYERTAELDWSRSKVRFSEAETIPLPKGVTLDVGSFPTSLMWRPLPELANATGHIVDGRKISAYRYSEPVSEILKTPNGEFDTLRIEKRRIDKNNRKLVIWIAPKFGNLPVQIVYYKDKKTTRFLLESAEGIDLGR